LQASLRKKKKKIRRYYSETFELINKEFVEIILLDDIFIIELLWRNFKHKNTGKYGNDYILSNPWLEYITHKAGLDITRESASV
jgi:hypothetical protein